MKRIFLVASLLWAGYTASAQVYVSVTGGYAWGVPSTKIGEESINGKESVRFGTFGEGINSSESAISSTKLGESISALGISMEKTNS